MKFRLMKQAPFLTAGAAGIILSAAAIAQQDMPDFAQLDQNGDDLIVIAELQPLASRQQQQARDILQKYDQNNDQGLDRQEYSRAVEDSLAQAGSSQNNRQASNQGSQGQGSKIIVQEKPAHITVDKPPAQITVRQSKPKVTVTTGDPQVEVKQGQPQVSVDKSKPEVSVEQTEPEVVVNEAEPEVTVDESEPQVNVRNKEPQVTVREKDQSRNQQDRNQQSQNQQQLSQSQQNQQKQSSQSQASSGDLYAMSIADIRSADVVDSQGNTIGGVEEIIVKNDGSDAGLVVRTGAAGGQQGQLVYIPLNAISSESDQLVLDQQRLVEHASNAEDFNPQDYNAVPESDRSLKDFVGEEELSQR